MENLMEIKRTKLIYAGKANNVYETTSPDHLELEASDRISAGNGAKRDVVSVKGIANNQISSVLFQYLEENGIPTHYLHEGSNPASKIVLKAKMIPLEVICRLASAGSFCKRYGFPEGRIFSKPFVEFVFKHANPEYPELSDPFIDRKTILFLSARNRINSIVNSDTGDPVFDLTGPELELIECYAARTSILLYRFYQELNVQLVDFKLEFGRLPSGQIILCDEISPDTCRLVDLNTGEKLDTCRLVDLNTGEKLDKDRFREDLSGLL